jgi:hypothetical protein
VDRVEGLFAIRQDIDYKGLLVPKVILGENHHTLCTNRNIHQEEVFTRDDWGFTRDLGMTGGFLNRM